MPAVAGGWGSGQSALGGGGAAAASKASTATFTAVDNQGNVGVIDASRASMRGEPVDAGVLECAGHGAELRAEEADDEIGVRHPLPAAATGADALAGAVPRLARGGAESRPAAADARCGAEPIGLRNADCRSR